ncbi:MAG: BTAD domain-containing putative transcriptional regulator [bacterium]
MQTNIPAKLQSPVINYIVFRERLFRVLDKARNKKSIWITGLPGSGKTTLIASYLSAKGLPHAWYHIDRSDIDLATFFYYLKLLVKGINGKKCVRLPALTPEYLQNISIFAKRYFEDLYTMLPKGFALVFDNYHEVNSNPLFHTIMHEALITVPEHGNVILISRTEPPDTFSRLRANSMMEVINNEMIKFTPEETHELIRLRSSENHTPDIIKKLHDWTDGWAAGIVLMLEQHKGGLDAISDRDFKDYQAIFDYFSAEIFDRLTSEMKEFLLKTSLFSSMTVDMANKMTKRDDSERILNELVKSQYFTIKRQDNTYTYHDLFREFLLVRAKTHFNEAELHHIYKHAAIILRKNGKIEDAVELYKKAGSVKDIQEIVIEHAQALIAQGRNRVLESWIKGMPEDILHGEPWLLYWLGEARAVFNPVEGRAYFEKSFKKFLSDEYNLSGTKHKKALLSDGVYLAWCGIVETFIYEYGNFIPLKKWITIMEKIMHQYPEFPSRELEARVLGILVFALTHYNPAHPKIRVWADHTLSILKYIKNFDQRIYYLFSLSHYFSWTGNLSKRGVFEGLIKKISPFTTIKILLMQKMYSASYARQIISKQECLDLVSEGLNIANKSGVHFLDHMIIVQAVYLFFAIDDLKRTETFLKMMEPMVNRSNALHVIQYDTLVGWLDYLQGNASLAIEKIGQSLELSIKAHIPFAQGLCRLALAQVLYDQGAYKEAEKHYKHGLRIARAMKSKSLEFTSYYIRAYWFLDEGHKHAAKTEKKGLRMLKKLMVLGRQYGLVNVYFAWGRKMRYLCLKALESNIEVKYVQHLIRRLELFPDTPPYTYENWPWAIKIYTLGSFKILHDDAPIVLSRKAQLKPIELLQFLIINHDKPVELDHISGVLWPDAPGDYAHQTLDTTIHRLRKLLGSNDAVISEAGRLMLNPKMCWVDVAAYEYLLNSTDSLMTGTGRSTTPSSDKQEEIRAMERRIFNIYRGDFFSQDSIPSWAIGFRSMLHDKFLHFIEMLGAYYERIGNTAQAILTYKKGLEIDNQAELFYQRLMLLYKLHGRTGEAVALYKRCEEILSRTLDIKPSDKTKEIYQSIIESKN